MNISATNLITDAARTIGAIASGEALSTNELNDGLVSLNKVMDALSAEGVDLMQLSTVTIIASGHGPFTTPRPIKIKAAASSSATLTAPVEVCSAEQWAQIADTTRTGTISTKMWCDYAYPTSNVYVWPGSTSPLLLYCYLPLTQYASLATSLDLPPGYAHLLTLLLACELCEQFERPVTQSLYASAQSAKGALAAINLRALGDAPAPLQPLPQHPAQGKAA